MATQISLPPPELKANDDGSTTEVFFRVNDSGKKVKVTRRVQVALEKVSTPEERRQWPRYVDASKRDDNTTQRCEPVTLRLVPRSVASPKDEDDGAKKVVRNVSCRFCGGDHLSFQCPLKDKIATTPETSAADPAAAAPSRGAPPPTGKYVPPGLAAARAAGTLGVPQRDESATLRVTNLADTVTEADLGRNFSRAGQVKRCNVVKNRMTGLSRGFAFVEFHSPQAAERARAMFDGKAAGSMIMHVDFSEPRK